MLESQDQRYPSAGRAVFLTTSHVMPVGPVTLPVMYVGPAPIIFRPIFNPSQEGGTKKPKKAGRDSRAFETNLAKGFLVG